MEALPLEPFLQLHAAKLLLLSTRVGAIISMGPIFSGGSMPRSFRIYLTIAISLMLATVVPAPDVRLFTPLDLGVVFVGELLVGMILGGFLQLIFAGLQLAGQTAGQQLGLALANVFNPALDDQSSTTSVVYVTVASLAFLGLGGDQEMIAALLESFAILPLGQVFYHDSVLEIARVVMQESMVLSLRIAGPVIVTLLIVEIAMGFIGRTVPQLNVQTIGFSLRILLGLLITMAALPAAITVFFEFLEAAFAHAYDAMAALSPLLEP